MRYILFSCLLASLALSAHAQDKGQTAPEGQLHTLTPQFVRQAAMGDLFEIQSSEHVHTRSKNGDIRAYAAQIITDHEASSEKLRTLAKTIPGAQYRIG